MKRAELHARILPLADEGREDHKVYGTAAQRLALVEELTREMWLLGGKDLPAYQRSEIPLKVFWSRQPRK